LTYARARLWLGISGVGAFVVVSGLAPNANPTNGFPKMTFESALDPNLRPSLIPLIPLTRFVADAGLRITQKMEMVIWSMPLAAMLAVTDLARVHRQNNLAK
jgi:hypothetical protein